MCCLINLSQIFICRVLPLALRTEWTGPLIALLLLHECVQDLGTVVPELDPLGLDLLKVR